MILISEVGLNGVQEGRGDTASGRVIDRSRRQLAGYAQCFRHVDG
jgi:hypothetical protein